MRQILFSITALLCSVAILTLGSGLLGTLLGVRMSLAAFPPPTIGLVMSAYFAGLVLGALFAGRVIRRAGHSRAFAVFAAAATASVLLHGLYVSAISWGLLRVITGLSIAGVYMVIESWLNERASNVIRGRVFSLYQSINYLGLGLGQLLLTARSPTGPDLFMVAALLFALSLIPIALTRAIHPVPPERHQMAWRALARGAPLGAVVCLGAGLVNGAVYGLAPVFALALERGASGVSWFMATLILGGFALQWPIGHLSDLYSRRLLILLVSLALAGVCGLQLALLAFWDVTPLAPLLAIALVFGGLSFTLYPLAVAHANDHLASQEFVGVSAALLFLWGLGAALGPLLAGLLMAWLGPRGLFVFCAVVALLCAAAAVVRRREAVPVEDQEQFVSMARTTPVIAELDPRSPDEEGGELPP